MQKIEYRLDGRQRIEVEVADNTEASVLIKIAQKSENNDTKHRLRRTRGDEASLDYLEDEFGLEAVDTRESSNPQRMAERREDIERVRKAVAALSPQHQEIVRLYFYEGKTEREIAAILGGDGAGIHRKLETIKKKLKKLL